MSHRKQRSAFDQVFKFDTERTVTYRDIVDYLSGKSVVVLDETKRRTTDVYAANGAMKEGCRRQNGMKLSLLKSHASVCNTTIQVWRHRGERMLNF
ncbi:hypothetical protein TNCV_4918281 [Trichonephila clavipes]|nr:hypothetical protein TNCV_4918281 [Trichonephila clavipes]